MWYFGDGGTPRGPVELAEIRRLIADGRVTPATLVWRDGFAGWLPAGQTELARLPPPTPAIPALPPPYAAAPVAYAPAMGYPAAGVHYAGFWIRVLAVIIDGVILQLSSLSLGLTFGLLFSISAASRTPASSFGLVLSGLGGVIVLLWGLAYYTAIPAGRWQATPGKRLVGIYVIRLSGAGIGFWGFVGRYLAYFLDSLTLGIGFMMAGWTREKRALHDMVCDTRVIYGRR